MPSAAARIARPDLRYRRAATERMRVHRARAARGRVMLLIEVELEATAGLLTDGPYLCGEFDFEDTDKVARGLEKFLDDLVYAKRHRIGWWRDASRDPKG